MDISLAEGEPFGGNILARLEEVAFLYHGYRGIFAYAAFRHINDAFFEGRLPPPFIQWAITPHSRCIGHTLSRIHFTSDPQSTGDPARWLSPPVITLHPSILGGGRKRGRKEDPWNIPPSHLGNSFAYDVLLHECIHVAVFYLHKRATVQLRKEGRGETSHNNDLWVSEVNRIAPLLGLSGVDAGRTKVKRVPVEGGEKTPTGKPLTKPARVNGGNVPFEAVSTFPYGLRLHLGHERHYIEDRLPFEFSCGLSEAAQSNT